VSWEGKEEKRVRDADRRSGDGGEVVVMREC